MRAFNYKVNLPTITAIFLILSANFTGSGSSNLLPKALPGLICGPRLRPGQLLCDNPKNCNLLEPNHNFTLPCDNDCREQHGSGKGGVCAVGGICDCDPAEPSKNADQLSHQCLDAKYAALFNNVCDEDCKCIHHKVDGYCNFETKTCVCGRTSPSLVLNCAYKNINHYHYLLNIIVKYWTIGIDVAAIFLKATS